MWLKKLPLPKKNPDTMMSFWKPKFPAVLLLLAVSTLFAACGGNKSAVFAGDSEPEAFMLSFQKPETFTFDIAEAGSYDFAIELTYYSEQMQNMDGQVPMYYILEGPGMGDGKDRKFAMRVSQEGEWLGELMENEHDRIVEEIFEEDMQLEAGQYSFKLYADSSNEGEPVQGIVRITFKVYQ